jgi:hypothetical protein
MGKQSKRKAVSKKEHKERQEERRTRVLQEVSTRNDNAVADDESYDDRVEEIMAWDRVWWRNQPGLDSWQRGIVHRVVTDELEPGISRYLVQRTEDEDGKELITVTAKDRAITGSDESLKTIRRDRIDWVPRFAVGDRVLAHARIDCSRPRNDTVRDEDDSDSIWVPVTVSKLWTTPPNSTALLNVYICKVDAPIAHFSAGTQLWVKDDSEGMITEHPSTFQFSVGETVLFLPTGPSFLMVLELQECNLGKRVELSKWMPLVSTVPVRYTR